VSIYCVLNNYLSHLHACPSCGDLVSTQTASDSVSEAGLDILHFSQFPGQWWGCWSRVHTKYWRFIFHFIVIYQAFTKHQLPLYTNFQDCHLFTGPFYNFPRKERRLAMQFCYKMLIFISIFILYVTQLLTLFKITCKIMIPINLISLPFSPQCFFTLCYTKLHLFCFKEHLQLDILPTHLILDK
jgi:hypothetical protein